MSSEFLKIHWKRNAIKHPYVWFNPCGNHLRAYSNIMTMALLISQKRVKQTLGVFNCVVSNKCVSVSFCINYLFSFLQNMSTYKTFNLDKLVSRRLVLQMSVNKTSEV